METFKAGFDRTVITPPHGTQMVGYFFERLSDGVLDDLELNTLAASDGKNTVVNICADLCGVPQARMDVYRRAVAKAVGVPYEAVYICCTHTHTGPDVAGMLEHETASENPPCASAWEESLCGYIVSSAQRAVSDMVPARIYIGSGKVERVSFIRRYRMKDGYVRTNPGVNNPDIVETIGEPDETEQLVRICREGKKEIVLVNFQVHPDAVGGTKISADYPRFVRQTVENGLGGAAFCIYYNGAQGDTNHVNTNPRPGEDNGLEPDTFDDVLRGYEFSQNMGRAIGGEALKVYGHAHAAPATPVKFGQKEILVPSQTPAAEQLPKALQIAELHNAGRDDQLPYEAMELTTAVAEALRMVRLKDGPEAFKLNIGAIAFGAVAFVGVPGEPFTEVGRRIKRESPFEMTIPTCLTNGSEGYYPMQDAYEEGGYEARSSAFRSGVAERIAEESVSVLKAL